MGYRLYCRNSGDRESEICFGKLIGYSDDQELKSLQYLLKIRKISKKDYENRSHWCDIMTIELNDTEFLKFMYYYIYDCTNVYDDDYVLITDLICILCLSDLIDKPCNKIIEWR